MSKRQNAIARAVLLAAAITSLFLASAPSASAQQEGVLIHTVMFSLHTAPDSEATKEFLRDGKEMLTKIPGVENFEVRRQVSKKNRYQFGFSMHFSDAAAFQRYLEHPLHTQFVKERWKPEVADFLEADYVSYDPK